jgi:hypothetical protein
VIASVGPNDALALVGLSLYPWGGTAWTAGSTLAGSYASLVGSGPDNLWTYGNQPPTRLVGGACQASTAPPITGSGSYNVLPLGPGHAWAYVSRYVLLTAVAPGYMLAF